MKISNPKMPRGWRLSGWGPEGEGAEAKGPNGETVMASTPEGLPGAIKKHLEQQPR